jgi:hypothetical protein
MNQAMRLMILLVLISSFILHPSSLLRADGGTIRLAELNGNYRITVFTSPTLVRVGPIDISVLVQVAATGEPVSGVSVSIKAVPRGSLGVERWYPATTEAATNKLYFATTLDLPEPGWYSLEVSIHGTQGEAQVRFELEVAEPAPAWFALAPWVGWPVLAILLFAIHQVLVRLRSR